MFISPAFRLTTAEFIPEFLKVEGISFLIERHIFDLYVKSEARKKEVQGVTKVLYMRDVFRHDRRLLFKDCQVKRSY